MTQDQVVAQVYKDLLINYAFCTRQGGVGKVVQLIEEMAEKLKN